MYSHTLHMPANRQAVFVYCTTNSEVFATIMNCNRFSHGTHINISLLFMVDVLSLWLGEIIYNELFLMRFSIFHTGSIILKNFDSVSFYLNIFLNNATFSVDYNKRNIITRKSRKTIQIQLNIC